MTKKTKWLRSDVFVIPLLNKTFSVGQVLDLQMENVVRIALYDEIINSIISVEIDELCKSKNLISLIASSREQLDYKVWKILGNKQQNIPVSNFPNEKYREKGWVGAISYDAALVEDFVNSFYSLLPWDDWFKPDYLDTFLIDPSKKPKNLIYKK